MADIDFTKTTLAREGLAIVRQFLSPEICETALTLLKRARTRGRRTLPPDLQRLQPLSAYLNSEEMGRLEELVDFARVNALFSNVLGPGAEISRQLLGLWIQPSARTYVIPWHRDIRDNAKGIDWQAWEERTRNLRFFNQFHIAFAPDRSFWVVPGSHSREDTQQEKSMFPVRPILVDFIERELDPWYDGDDRNPTRNAAQKLWQRVESYYFRRLGGEPLPWHRERNRMVERKTAEYCSSMPGAVEVRLNAGDLMMYRNCSWHTAVYRVDEPRFTLFSNIATPENNQWRREQKERVAALGENTRWFNVADRPTN